MTTKMKTEAAAMISCYDHKKKYDMYCKKLLSNKQILAYVMKGCIPEYADIPLEEDRRSSTESPMQIKLRNRSEGGTAHENLS